MSSVTSVPPENAEGQVAAKGVAKLAERVIAAATASRGTPDAFWPARSDPTVSPGDPVASTSLTAMMSGGAHRESTPATSTKEAASGGQSDRESALPTATGVTKAGVAGANVVTGGGDTGPDAVAVASAVLVAAPSGVLEPLTPPAAAVCVSSAEDSGLPQAIVAIARVTMEANVSHFMKMVPR
jgi:hypothetical protein